MKKTNITTIVTALTAGAFIGCGSAAINTADTTALDREDGRHPSFATMDADGDGFATPDEINTTLFAKLDIDKDGRISKEEHDGARPERAERGMEKGDKQGPKHGDGPPRAHGKKQGKGMHAEQRPSFEECDTDGDGFISADEFQGPEERFAKVDTNSDGKISKEERDAATPPRDGRGMGRGNENRPKDGRGPRKDPPQRAHGEKQGKGMHAEQRPSFEECDTDGDGFISADEFQGPEERFAEVDTNSDGKISKEERDAATPPRDGRGMGRGNANRPKDGRGPGRDAPPRARGEKQGRGMHPEQRPSFEECDTNSDGFITPDEFKAADKMLEMADADGDGNLSDAEYESMNSKRGKDHGARSEKGPRPGPGDGHGKKHGKRQDQDQDQVQDQDQ